VGVGSGAWLVAAQEAARTRDAGSRCPEVGLNAQATVARVEEDWAGFRGRGGKKERRSYTRCQACVKGALASKAPLRWKRRTQADRRRASPLEAPRHTRQTTATATLHSSKPGRQRWRLLHDRPLRKGVAASVGLITHFFHSFSPGQTVGRALAWSGGSSGGSPADAKAQGALRTRAWTRCGVGRRGHAGTHGQAQPRKRDLHPATGGRCAAYGIRASARPRPAQTGPYYITQNEDNHCYVS
jgi:hypothetical protein